MLQDILNFIKENYKLLLILLGFVLESIFIVIFKKRPTEVIDKDAFYEAAVDFIKQAEFYYKDVKSKSGKAKISMVRHLLFKKFGYLPSFTDEMIEKILSTPEKKKEDWSPLPDVPFNTHGFE